MGRTGTHVIVVGNEKGGSGKSTTSFHLAIYLLYQGFRVATIDVDSRQQTLTSYVKNRRVWAQSRDLKLPHTTHFHLPLTRSDSIKENQKLEFDLFRQAVVEVEGSADFLIVEHEKGAQLSVAVGTVSAQAVQRVEDLPKLGETAEVRPSPALVKVLQESEREMAKLGDEYISTEHLLLALTGSCSGVADVLPDRGPL